MSDLRCLSRGCMAFHMCPPSWHKLYLGRYFGVSYDKMRFVDFMQSDKQGTRSVFILRKFRHANSVMWSILINYML